MLFEQVSESALDLVPATGFFASSALELVEAANTSTNPNPNPKPNPDANPNQVSAADDASAARDVDVMPFQAGDRVRIEMTDREEVSIFGAIDQKIVKWG